MNEANRCWINGESSWTCILVRCRKRHICCAGRELDQGAQRSWSGYNLCSVGVRSIIQQPK